MKPTTRFLSAAAFVLVPLLAIGTTASAAVQTITFQLRASAVGQTSTFTFTQDVDASAPATVTAGGALTVTLTPGPNTVPTSAGGYTVNNIRGLSLSLPVPANSTYVSASLSGGSGLGSAAPSVSLQSGNIVLKVPGPIAGGAHFQLPAVSIHLTAGTSGTIATKLGGTSYDNPGLSFTANVHVLFFNVDAPSAGYPSPNPVLTTTTIG
ncbi:cyclase [Solihabitans fulvus]|uniref:Cyclase n=1 Tax=Solihabitans fulvus TaxID=1892852 RepID=A0A5B2XQ83_9PSEU|nr:cyclase [Solihabitans fulvus]KAA2266088.1 cyclase [Solihabitans fulvus]